MVLVTDNKLVRSLGENFKF